MQENINGSEIPSTGRIIAIDPGMRHIGIAVSDESQIIPTPIDPIERRSWKRLLTDLRLIIAKYDAVAVVVGLPLNTDGTESQMSSNAREMARKLALSIHIPVLLQDERVTSYEARKRLWDRGVKPEDTKQYVDSEAAAIILADLLDRLRSKR